MVYYTGLLLWNRLMEHRYRGIHHKSASPSKGSTSKPTFEDIYAKNNVTKYCR